MPANPRPSEGHYGTLGVPLGASTRQIEVAFDAWRRRFGAGEIDREAFGLAEGAYHVLAAPGARERHDRQLGLRPHPALNGGAGRVARACTRRALRCLGDGRPGPARELLERAVALAPADPIVHSYLALALARTRKRLHEAARHGQFAVERRPGEPAFLFNLAEVYAAAGLTGRMLSTRAQAWRAAAAALFRPGRGAL